MNRYSISITVRDLFMHFMTEKHFSSFMELLQAIAKKVAEVNTQNGVFLSSGMYYIASLPLRILQLLKTFGVAL